MVEMEGAPWCPFADKYSDQWRTVSHVQLMMMQFGASSQKMLSGRFDESHARVSISAGAGGMDAQDWAEMLERMYTQVRLGGDAREACVRRQCSLWRLCI